MSGPVRSSIQDFAACAFILLFHFANYIVYTEYDRVFPDVLIVTGGLCVLAATLTLMLRVRSGVFRAVIFAILITIVVGDALFEFGTKDDISLRLVALSATLLMALAVVLFLREKATLVLSGSFVAMFVATVVIGLYEENRTSTADLYDRQAGKYENLPIVVHIILDEHAGLAGMHAGVAGDFAAAESLRKFYTGFGFRLFGGAYSEFFKTETSLAGALNFDSSADAARFLRKKHYGFSLNKNRYLKTYADMGYRVRVYQSDYLDFCRSEGVVVTACQTYRPDFLSSSAISKLPTMERVRLIFGMYYSSIAVVKITKLAGKHLKAWAATLGINLPALELWHGRVGPIAAMPTFKRFIRDISVAPGGIAFFGHFLMPHYPYVYNADCDVRSPISTWNLRHIEKSGNTPESRRRNYAQYFEQIGCVQKQLGALFSAMKKAGTFDKATVVVHGDHGARIGLVDPQIESITKLTAADFADAYSTLFALKAPNVSKGIDTKMVSLPTLISYAVTRSEDGFSESSAPSVFVGAENARISRWRLPRFPALDSPTQ